MDNLCRDSILFTNAIYFYSYYELILNIASAPEGDPAVGDGIVNSSDVSGGGGGDGGGSV